MPPKKAVPTPARLERINTVISTIGTNTTHLSNEERIQIITALDNQKKLHALKPVPYPHQHPKLTRERIDDDSPCIFGMSWSTASHIIRLEALGKGSLFFEENYLANYVEGIPQIRFREVQDLKIQVGRDDPVIHIDPHLAALGSSKEKRQQLNGNQVIAYHDLAKQLIRSGLPAAVRTMVENDICKYDPRQVPAKGCLYTEVTSSSNASSFVSWEAYRCAQLGVLHSKLKNTRATQAFSVEKVVIVDGPPEYRVLDVFTGIPHPCSELNTKTLKITTDLEHWKKHGAWPGSSQGSGSGSQAQDQQGGLNQVQAESLNELTGKVDDMMGDILTLKNHLDTLQSQELLKGQQDLDDRITELESKPPSDNKEPLFDGDMGDLVDKMEKSMEKIRTCITTLDDKYEKEIPQLFEDIDTLIRNNNILVHKCKKLKDRTIPLDLHVDQALNKIEKLIDDAVTLYKGSRDLESQRVTKETFDDFVTAKHEKLNTSFREHRANYEKFIVTCWNPQANTLREKMPNWEALVDQQKIVNKDHPDGLDLINKSTADLTTQLEEQKKESAAMKKESAAMKKESAALKKRIVDIEESLTKIRSIKTSTPRNWGKIVKTTGRRIGDLGRRMNSPTARKIALVLGAVVGTYYAGRSIPFSLLRRKIAVTLAEHLDPHDLSSIVGRLSTANPQSSQEPTGMEL